MTKLTPRQHANDRCPDCGSSVMYQEWIEWKAERGPGDDAAKVKVGNLVQSWSCIRCDWAKLEEVPR